MTVATDLNGKKFGMLTVIGRSDKRTRNRANWIVECECGTIKTVVSDKLNSGNTVSCGCYRDTVGNIKHLMSGTSLYYTWGGMINRCTNSKNPAYCNYGGRGIQICDEWKDDFQTFAKWASENGYDENLSIDRIDNDKGYFPENCRWATKEEQSNNTRRNVWIAWNGENHTIAEWSRIFKVNYSLIYGRYKKNKEPREIFSGLGAVG